MISDIWQHYWPVALGSLVPFIVVWLVRCASDTPRLSFSSISQIPELSQLPLDQQRASLAATLQRFYRSGISILPYLAFGLFFCTGIVCYEMLRDHGAVQTSRWLAVAFGTAGAIFALAVAHFIERALIRHLLHQRPW